MNRRSTGNAPCDAGAGSRIEALFERQRPVVGWKWTIRIGQSSRENEKIPGTRAGDIQHAQLFLPVGKFIGGAAEFVGKGGKRPRLLHGLIVVLAGYSRQATERAMPPRHGMAARLPLGREVGDNHHRELQSLGLVDTHEPDDIGGFRQSRGLFLARLARNEITEPGRELMQSEETRAVERPSEIDEFPQIGELAITQEFELHCCIVAGVGQHAVEEPGDREPVLLGAPRSQLADRALGGGALIVRERGEQFGVVKSGPDAIVVDRDQEDRLIRKVEKG